MAFTLLEIARMKFILAALLTWFAAPLHAQVHIERSEPAATVQQFFSALASGDTKAAAALLQPDVLIFESGGLERSRAEYEAHHLGADAAFLKSAQHEVLLRSGDAVGDLAWVATQARLKKGGDKPLDLFTLETMVLKRTASGWRIAHIHWSSRPVKAKD
jgi:ketosteroid isomerase-like protein